MLGSMISVKASNIERCVQHRWVTVSVLYKEMGQLCETLNKIKIYCNILLEHVDYWSTGSGNMSDTFRIQVEVIAALKDYAYYTYGQ